MKTEGTPLPKKSLGQHFLTNPQICQRIVSLLKPEAKDKILEIGPGPGALTRLLEHLPYQKLVLIEKDAWWAQARAANPRIEVKNQDAMKFDWLSLAIPPAWKFIGNLPYNIASPLIWEIMKYCQIWKLAVFMVQKEVAQRITAPPGSKIYGAISVWTQAHARVKLEFTLAPGAFSPPPKVDSSVISLEPLPDRPQYPDELSRLLHILFQQRRKQIGVILKKAPAFLDALKALAIPPTLRPEQLSPEEFIKISRQVAIANNHSRLSS